MPQALEYARILDIPCVFSSNGDGFYFMTELNNIFINEYKPVGAISCGCPLM